MVEDSTNNHMKEWVLYDMPAKSISFQRLPKRNLIEI